MWIAAGAGARAEAGRDRSVSRHVGSPCGLRSHPFPVSPERGAPSPSRSSSRPDRAVTCPASASTIPSRRRARASFSLRQGFFVVALAVGLLVWGLLIFVIVRYRRRSDAVPSQRPRNITVEVDHTVAPIFTVAVLFGFSVATDQNVTDLDP